MAIGSYYDVYNVEAYKQRSADVAESIQQVSSTKQYFEQKQLLKQQIHTLKNKEQRLFKLLGVKDIEDLNKRIQKYNNVVVNFSGNGLYQNFIGILKAKNAAEYEAFNTAVSQVIDKLLSHETVEEIGLKKAQEIVLNYLNKSKTFTKGAKGPTKFSSTQGMTLDGFWPASFTEFQRKQWENVLKQLAKNKKKGAAARAYFEVKNNKNTVTSTFTWNGITQNLTQKEAEQEFSENTEERDRINLQIKNLILEKTGGDVQDKALMSSIVDHVIKENPYVFFVGKNYNEITGILGEIKGIFYLATLFGKKWQDVITWKGGTFSDDKGKKPHQDILFKNFGIQIKNTTQNDIKEMHRVGFTSVSLNEFLQRIDISEDAKNLFLNYFGTLNFNVEYKKVKNKSTNTYIYKKGINEKSKRGKEFRKERETFVKYQQDIDRLLGVFASVLMYIEANKLTNNFNDINTLFLVGGTAFYTASSILQKVLEEIESEEKIVEHSFSTILQQSDINIISALMDHNRSPNYSKLAIDSIKLTSSYKF